MVDEEPQPTRSELEKLLDELLSRKRTRSRIDSSYAQPSRLLIKKPSNRRLKARLETKAQKCETKSRDTNAASQLLDIL